jgi:hypothetical protein
MPLRFYRRFRAGPFRVNLSKNRVSWSVGGRGAWMTFGDGRVRTSHGIPGRGLGWYEQRQLTTPAIAAHMPTLRTTLRRALWTIAMLFIAGVALMLGAAVLPRKFEDIKNTISATKNHYLANHYLARKTAGTP